MKCFVYIFTRCYEKKALFKTESDGDSSSKTEMALAQIKNSLKIKLWREQNNTCFFLTFAPCAWAIWHLHENRNNSKINFAIRHPFRIFGPEKVQRKHVDFLCAFMKNNTAEIRICKCYMYDAQRYVTRGQFITTFKRREYDDEFYEIFLNEWNGRIFQQLWPK